MMQPVAKITCECGARLKLPPLKGKRFRCKNCKTIHDSPYQTAADLEPVEEKRGLKKMAPKRRTGRLGLRKKTGKASVSERLTPAKPAEEKRRPSGRLRLARGRKS